MCTYSYKNFSIEKKNHHCELEKSVNKLPVDDNGLCIFHSRDLSWKKENDFYGYLKKYIAVCRESQSEIDLREVHFVAAKGKIAIDYLDVLSGSDFHQSEFHGIIECVGNTRRKVIPQRLAFQDCVFHHEVIFKRCTFKHEVEFSACTLESEFSILSLEMEDCIFEGYFEFSHQTNFTSHLTICECHFKEEVLFQEIEKIDNCFDIISNTFDENFTFKESEISTAVINFTNNTFNENAEFYDVALKGTVLFNRPKVESKLMFTGTSERKILYGNTSFEVKPQDIRGQIIFQQTQLMLIERSHLEVLKKLEKTGVGDDKKVVIGPGCIKYRWQTPAKTLKTNLKNGLIIEELVRSFAAFFTNDAQKVLGVEILDRTAYEITFFYFSDENMSGEEISDTFIDVQEKFFGIMSNYYPVHQETLSEKDQLNIFQTKLSQNSTLIKILSEIQRSNWNLPDSESLLQSLTLPEQQLIFSESFHQQLLQTRLPELLAFARAQNIPINLFPTITYNVAKNMVKTKKVKGNINNF
ncbi:MULTISPECIES: pentapeptide repeat-containing protein [unclassified Chryseobacterium]|uniref:pentapeptide repeat-containing protein n=1 Tax=unclassified Chryseobacterium TaxID=2593645 RepID=UPI000D39A4BC|nr:MULTISPECIES: pentapeptide repeat-containing protein [unclassified Chryseobacterium]PTT76542.1 hypothetical protein DBR25_05515 [Chryseobacterium sp. HMWF001]PVV55573.1 hypothetical protein DD829_13970 [Chryseobacterium sp. HMWF035]